MLFTPDRKKIFEQTDADSICDYANCSHYGIPNTSASKKPVCMASCNSECLKVDRVASELNSFISENDDVFMLIHCTGG